MNIHYTNMPNLVRCSIFICVEEDPKFHENHDFLNFAPTLFRSVLNTLECNINQYRYMLPYRTKSRVKTTQSCGSEYWVKWLHYGTIGSHSSVLKNNLIHPTLVKRKLFIVYFLLRGYPARNLELWQSTSAVNKCPQMSTWKHRTKKTHLPCQPSFTATVDVLGFSTLYIGKIYWFEAINH